VSDGHLRATMTRRGRVPGKYVFDGFPRGPDRYRRDESGGSRNRALQLKPPDAMPVQKSDIRWPSATEDYEERYWSPVNSPVLNKDRD
jgi:hypothetical protein